MIREITTFICTKSGFTLGTDIFFDKWPQDKPDDCLLISFAGGGSIIPHEKDMAIPTVQVLSRAMDNIDAMTNLITVYNAIHATHGWNMPNFLGSGADYLAMSILALAFPQSLGQDVNGRFNWSCNFQFYMEQASCGP